MYRVKQTVEENKSYVLLAFFTASLAMLGSELLFDDRNASDILAKALLVVLMGYLFWQSVQKNNPKAKIKLNELNALVFSGGGAKGVAHVGAYEALIALGEEKSYEIHRQILRVAGTSAGSIMAMCVAVGCTIEHMKSKLSDDFTQFFDSKKVTVKVGSVIRTGALNKGETLRQWIEEIIHEKTGIQYCTFNELAEMKGKKHLAVVAQEIKKNKSTIFQADPETGDVVISDAVRASAGVPFLFEKFVVRKKREGHGLVPFKRTTEEPEGATFHDGGVVQNYPIDVFDPIRGNKTLGFMLNDSSSDSQPKLGATAQSLIDHEKARLRGSVLNSSRTVEIDTLGVSMLAFNLPEERREALLKSGWNALNHYFGVHRDYSPGSSASNQAQARKGCVVS